jgi:hypothetical protein
LHPQLPSFAWDFNPFQIRKHGFVVSCVAYFCSINLGPNHDRKKRTLNLNSTKKGKERKKRGEKSKLK